MIYQIFYDENSEKSIHSGNHCITPCGVHRALGLKRKTGYIYDDQKIPNLSEYNTLCEWRVLFYVWKHFPSKSKWIGFTSWRHGQKGFSPGLAELNEPSIRFMIQKQPISGFSVRPLKSLMLKNMGAAPEITLKNQFLQWSMVEASSGITINDLRQIPLAKYHSAPYWDFVMNEYRLLYGVNLEKELDWVELGKIDMLHTWCNAFIAHWDYFNDYMSHFSPIVMRMIDHFGNHPSDLELSYICERLIILYNYIRYSENRFCSPKKIAPLRCDCSKNKPQVLPRDPKQTNRTPGCSLIVCSVDDRKYANLVESVGRAFCEPVQIIRIKDALSLAEGYNRGASQATGKICIFCHDDIEFLGSDVDKLLAQDLAIYDIVGVAGTSRLTTGKWIQAGAPYIHGHVAHGDLSANRYSLCIYGAEKDPGIVGNIQALDGLFFAVKRDVLSKIKFDQDAFDGFHLYDLDFTFSAYLRDLKLAVDYRLMILHQSGGRFDHAWHMYAQRFNEKFVKFLDPVAGRRRPEFKYFTFRSKETLIQAMRLLLDSKNMNRTNTVSAVMHI